MKSGIITIVKYIIIMTVVAGSVLFFGYQMYRNLGGKSRASVSGSVTISLTNSATGVIIPGTTFTVGVLLSTNPVASMSAADLFFTDVNDTLDFIPPDASFPLEMQSVKAFDEELRGSTMWTSRPDGTKKIERITLVAKRSEANLKSVATLRLRFKPRPSASFAYPSQVALAVNTASSMIVGPNINGNRFALPIINPSLSITLGCADTTTCTTGNLCYQNVCRVQCGTGGSCSGLYHCENNVCMPGEGGGSSSSSSTSYAPTVTPFPTAKPDKAQLYFKVKMPDLPPVVAIAPNVHVKVLANPIIDMDITLTRKAGTDLFQSPLLELDIPAGSAQQYTVKIKQQKTIQRSFTVTLQRGETANCIAADSSCIGSLKDSHLAPLLGGDSDESNSINSLDLDKVVEQYQATSLPAGANADFNLDGKVDVMDLGILGKNFGKSGE